MPQKKTKFVLNVSYSLSKYSLEETDSRLEGIVGRPKVGSGANIQTSERDVDFHFDDLKEAKKALKRIKAKSFKGTVQEQIS